MHVSTTIIRPFFMCCKVTKRYALLNPRTTSLRVGRVIGRCLAGRLVRAVIVHVLAEQYSSQYLWKAPVEKE